MREPISCYVASVNRTLSVLAAVWVLVPMAVVLTGVKPGPDDGATLHAFQGSRHEQASPADSQEQPELCQGGKAHGLAYTLCIATAHPNRKNARVTNGR